MSLQGSFIGLLVGDKDLADLLGATEEARAAGSRSINRSCVGKKLKQLKHEKS